jgi:hypothetical protein
MRPSLSQLDYLDRLAREARVPVPYVQTMGEASEEIDWLQSQIALRPGTRAAIFAKLNTSRQTKEDMYMALGIDSLAVQSAATEFDGQQCLRWLDTLFVEVTHHRVTVENREKALNMQTQQEQKPAARPIRRPGRPTVSPPGPAVTVREPPETQGRPASVPSIRRPMTPARVAVSTTDGAPDLIPGVDRDEQGQIIPFEQADEAPRRLTWEEIEAITLGVTLETAQECLAKLRSLGVEIIQFGYRLDHWGLWETEVNFLGLMPPPKPWHYGSTTDRTATSAWWSRNHAFEEARCAPPF